MLAVYYVYYLVASKLILTQLAYADTSYHSQFLCMAELELKKINFHGWVGLLMNGRIRLSSVSPGFELGLWLSLANLKMTTQIKPTSKMKMISKRKTNTTEHPWSKAAKCSQARAELCQAHLMETNIIIAVHKQNLTK